MLPDKPRGQAFRYRLGRSESGFRVFAGGSADLVVHRPGAHASVGLELADLGFAQPQRVLQRFDGEVVVRAGSEAVATGSQRCSRGGQTRGEGVFESPVIGQHRFCVSYLTRDERLEQRDRLWARRFLHDLVAVQRGPVAQCHSRSPLA